MSQNNNNLSVDSAATIISGVVLGTIGVLSFIVQPGLVQGFVTLLGMTEAEANQLAFMEMVGVAIATYLNAVLTKKSTGAGYWRPRWPLRYSATCCPSSSCSPICWVWCGFSPALAKVLSFPSVSALSA